MFFFMTRYDAYDRDKSPWEIQINSGHKMKIMERQKVKISEKNVSSPSHGQRKEEAYLHIGFCAKSHQEDWIRIHFNEIISIFNS